VRRPPVLAEPPAIGGDETTSIPMAFYEAVNSMDRLLPARSLAIYRRRNGRSAIGRSSTFRRTPPSAPGKQAEQVCGPGRSHLPRRFTRKREAPAESHNGFPGASSFSGSVT
jgi:hypothetical protein